MLKFLKIRIIQYHLNELTKQGGKKYIMSIFALRFLFEQTFFLRYQCITSLVIVSFSTLLDV